ncbi:MAG: hypothetical protein ABH823_01445, partial [bacterium]
MAVGLPVTQVNAGLNPYVVPANCLRVAAMQVRRHFHNDVPVAPEIVEAEAADIGRLGREYGVRAVFTAEDTYVNNPEARDILQAEAR